MQSVHAEDPVEWEQGGAAQDPAWGVCASRLALASLDLPPCPRPMHPTPAPLTSLCETFKHSVPSPSHILRKDVWKSGSLSISGSSFVSSYTFATTYTQPSSSASLVISGVPCIRISCSIPLRALSPLVPHVTHTRMHLPTHRVRWSRIRQCSWCRRRRLRQDTRGAGSKRLKLEVSKPAVPRPLLRHPSLPRVCLAPDPRRCGAVNALSGWHVSLVLRPRAWPLAPCAQQRLSSSPPSLSLQGSSTASRMTTLP